MPRPSTLLLLLAVLACGGFAHAQRAATPSSSKGASGKAERSVPDPAILDRVLGAHVRKGRVDYAALSKDRQARAQLDAFLSSVATMPAKAPLSAWLNAYNALVIDAVLERYPVASVMKVPGFFKRKWPVAGRARSLDEIEHEIIRPRFEDARVHFALNCGARSCPPLPAKAFREASLDAKLTALVRNALADPRHVTVEDGKLVVSALFVWFEQDFVREAGSVLGWIKRFGDSELRELPAAVELVERDYDWSLADAGAR